MQIVYATIDGREAALISPDKSLLLEVGALAMHDPDTGHWRQIAYYGEQDAWEIERGLLQPGLAEPAEIQSELKIRSIRPLELWTQSGPSGGDFDHQVGKGAEIVLVSSDEGLVVHLDYEEIAIWQADDAGGPDDCWFTPAGSKLGEQFLIRAAVPDVVVLEPAALGPRHRLSALAGRSI